MGVGAVAPLALAGGPGLNGLLAQQLGHILVGALLIAAQVEKGVGVADDPLPGVLEELLELGDILQDDGGHHIPGAHGGLEPCIPVRQGHIGELVEQEPHGDRQLPAVYLVRLIVELLEGLGIEHPHQEIERYVVAVRDDAEDGLLALP